MSKSKKHERPSFADFLAELTSKTPAKPAVESREERRFFLIVTEGKRTEPIYFEFLAGKLPKKLVETIEVKGEGANTLSLVREALKKKKKRLENKELPPFDEVWAVFDKDDFPDKNFNDAIALAKRENIESGHSNESFELWYVLHYEFLQSALKRTDYITKLTTHLGEKYEKNKRELAERIHINGNYKQAIKRAVRLQKLHEDKTDSESCPMTRVYVLVERLMAYVEGREAEH